MRNNLRLGAVEGVEIIPVINENKPAARPIPKLLPAV